MVRGLCTLAVAASLLATGAAFVQPDIPGDMPVSALLTTAQSRLSSGQTNEALTYYDAAIARDPSNYLTFFKRGATYLSLGKTNQATDDFNKVLSLQPGFEGAHTQLAKIKAKSADWAGARAEYAAANKAADSPDVLELQEAENAAQLAEAALAASQWDDCATHASNAILVAGRAPHLREVRAKCRFERGDLDEAMQDLRHLLNMRPGDTEPHIVISATSFYALGEMDKGMEQIRKCLHSDPESKVCKKIFNSEKAISKKFKKVTGQLERGQTTTAGRSLVGTADESGLLTDVKVQLEELRKDGSIRSATKSILYEKVAEMTCQAYSESNHKDVSKYCDEVLELNPDSFWGLLHRGKAQMKKEDYEASVRTLQDALDKHPQMRDKIQPVLQKATVALKRSKTKDYYKVLEVPHDADERQIKSAYRKASKKYHPDKAVKQGVTKEEAEKKMTSINEAYEVLSNPELRARFDAGDDPNSHESGSGRNPFEGSPFNFGGGGFGPGGGQRKTSFKFNTGGAGKQGGGNPFGQFQFDGQQFGF
ncbi:uncharacterized protein F5Z01DRAFT_422490 [Emericellopsis atlantica]|uniref:Tetratricopeptide repeat and J domain-containing co-chaperone DNJ1 n=1 Tax=Emericellopsis atlantica TaxID=2614577 RepID=A0A9P7ZEE5_9HYPO|nr:uncharacterized protein F5Z01DRAFT_422490 [Emericellopsis atlantica]KAG9250142.1 hypothetical protein F5Z01DRAFT_422490 [Emericellopsis atlantica]